MLARGCCNCLWCSLLAALFRSSPGGFGWPLAGGGAPGRHPLICRFFAGAERCFQRAWLALAPARAREPPPRRLRRSALAHALNILYPGWLHLHWRPSLLLHGASIAVPAFLANPCRARVSDISGCSFRERKAVPAWAWCAPLRPVRVRAPAAGARVAARPCVLCWRLNLWRITAARAS